jgi:hypothetical protein
VRRNEPLFVSRDKCPGASPARRGRARALRHRNPARQ